MLLPEYSVSSFVPAPFTLTVLPSLFVTAVPLLAPNFKPLFVKSVLAPSNWFTLTASVPFTPDATLIIVLLPLFNPVFVKDTVPFEPPVIVTPSLFITVLPVVTLLRPVKSLESCTVSVFVPGAATTPILFSERLFSAAPPVTLMAWSELHLMTLLSPVVALL